MFIENRLYCELSGARDVLRAVDCHKAYHLRLSQSPFFVGVQSCGAREDDLRQV